MFDFIPTRLVLAALAFLGFSNLYLIRFNFSVILVSMLTKINGSQTEDCELNPDCSSEVPIFNKVENEFSDWDEQSRASVLSAFNYGYCLTQILGGRLAELFGCKHVFGIAVLGPGVLSFLLPVASKANFWWAFLIRFLQGFIQGMAWPSMQAVLGQWFPVAEKSRFMGIVCFAATLSMVYIMPLSGFLCDTFDWETATYITAGIPVVWAVFWFSLVYSKPSLHPRISEKERRYIEESVCKSGTSFEAKKSVPWKSIVTSLPFIAIVVCDVGNSYCLAIFTSQLPNYLSSVYKFNLSKTGFLAGVPFLSRYIGSVFFSIIADHLIKKETLSVTSVRKIFSVIAMFLPAMAIVAMTASMTYITTFIWLVSTYMFFNGSITSSQLVNFSDISPNYAGTLFGISNTFASLFSAISLWNSGKILGEDLTVQDWRILFASLIPVLVCTEAFYLYFASGSPQKWNFYEKEIINEEEDVEK